MTYLDRQNAAIDLLERARIVGMSDPHLAEELIHNARELYPIDSETKLILLTLARPSNSRDYTTLEHMRAPVKKQNPNKVMAARAAWQRRRAGGSK